MTRIGTRTATNFTKFPDGRELRMLKHFFATYIYFNEIVVSI